MSHETISIYRHIYKDTPNGGRLYPHLRHAHQKRKKRYGAYNQLKRVLRKKADQVARSATDLLTPFGKR